MMNATIEKVQILDTEFSYIDYHNDKQSSVAGLIIPITPDVQETLLNVGGFFRDLLTPLNDDDSIQRIVVLSVTERDMTPFIGFHFDNGDDIVTSWAKEPKLVTSYQEHIQKKDIPHEWINSLEFIRDNPKENYSKMLNDYYHPKVTDDTGIYVDDEMLEYGQSVTINNVQELIAHYPELKGGALDILDVDTIQLEINIGGLSLMGIIGSGAMYKDGVAITTSIDYYHMNHLKDHPNDTFDKFISDTEMDILHDNALRINRALRSKIRSKETVMSTYIGIIHELFDEFDEPAVELIHITFLRAAIKHGHIEI